MKQHEMTYRRFSNEYPTEFDEEAEKLASESLGDITSEIAAASFRGSRVDFSHLTSKLRHSVYRRAASLGIEITDV